MKVTEYIRKLRNKNIDFEDMDILNKKYVYKSELALDIIIRLEKVVIELNDKPLIESEKNTLEGKYFAYADILMLLERRNEYDFNKKIY